MSQYIQQHGRRGALLLLALVFALPASARDIVEVSAQLFLTRDETAGIQLPKAEGGFDRISNLYTIGFFGGPFLNGGELRDACDQDINVPGVGTCFFNRFEETDPADRGDLGLWGPQYYKRITTPLAVAYDQNDFTQSSVSQFRDIGINIGREATRPRIRPMMAAWVYDTGEDTFTIADRSLGPVLADRPQTLGKGRFSMGWSYQRIDWTRFEGQKLSSLNIRVLHQDSNGDGVLTGQETDYIDVAMSYELSQNYMDFFLEYGVTNDLDFSIAIPVVQTNLKISAFAGQIQQQCPGLGPELCFEPGLDANAVAIYEAFQDSPFFYNDSPLEDAPGFPRVYPGVQEPGVGRAMISDINGQQWNQFWSRQSHGFCEENRDETFYSLRAAGGERGCPGGNDQTQKGDRANTFFGEIADLQQEKAIGIGDLRIRAKWHPIKAQGFIPDLAWVGEIRPPTGKEDDYMGTGALSTSNYLVGAWALGPFRPHFNVGVEISAGPDWQDSTQWAFGFEWMLADWLSVSFDQLGRVPFGNEVARRYDYGGGVKFIPTPGVGLFFDFIKPINKNEGLTADLTWRLGGQILF